MTYSERVQKVRESMREQLESQLRQARDPKPQPKYLAETTVEGKTVAEWATIVDTAIEKEEERVKALPTDIRLDANDYVMRSLVLIDTARLFPGKVTDAIHRWRAAGSPTEADETLKTIRKLREEAEKCAALAQLQSNNADKAAATGDNKKAEQHTRYAATQQEKANKFFAEADEVAAAWKRDHP